MFLRIGSCVAVCAALVVTSSVRAQSDTEAMLILNQNAMGAGDSRLILLSGPDDAVIRSLDELETRIVLMPPGPGDMLPASATAVISITQPGSYVLGANLYGVSGKHGIEILKSNVTLDLNGYALIGVPGSKGGIDAPSGVVNIKIHNGAIRGWKERGIGGLKMTASEISDVRVGNCSWNGIHLGQGLIRNCTSRQNGNDGIHVEHGKSVIESCAVELNGGDGVECGDGSVLRDVASSGNGGHGFRMGGGGVSLESCTATDNAGDGIDLSGGSSVRGCTVTGNGGVGINGSSSVVTGCAVQDNSEGGIIVYTKGQVRDCTISEHRSGSGFGIQIYGYGTVENNTVSSSITGIHVRDNSCRVVGNQVISNSVGILVEHSNNLIDGNSLENNNTGLKVTATNNLVVRNTSRSLNDYDIVSGNNVGTISTDPTTAGAWDNFDF